MPEPLASLTILNNRIEPCKEGTMCHNSPFHSLRPKCNSCRLSPLNDRGMFAGVFPQEWKPVSSKWKHSVLEKEKRDAKRKKAIERQKERQAKDPAKQARLRAAARAERKTNAKIIRATINSGRVNRDGDHLLYNDIVVDTKLQSTAENPVVRLHELDKVRADAKRNGKAYGVLCLQNRVGRSVITIDAADFAKILERNQRKDLG